VPLSDIAAEDRIQNREIALSRGERNFDTSVLVLMKAFITTFSQFNMSVINLDKDIGYILAEGDVPVSPEKFKELGMKNVERLNDRIDGVIWQYVGSNMETRITVNLITKKDYITAKMGFSAKTVGNAVVKNNELPPFMVDAMYTELWTEFDKQLFILQSTN